MSEPFVGEIRMFAGNYAPRGWAFCDGQLLAVSQNDALFSLLGTVYGGDGRSTFGLPDMRGRIPIHMGSGPGLRDRRLGSRGGAEKVTLTTDQLPSHGHLFTGTDQLGNTPNPSGNAPAKSTAADAYVDERPSAVMASGLVTNSGGSQSHSNLQPYLALHFIIALFGIYPSRY